MKLKKGVPFKWSDVEDKAFKQIKFELSKSNLLSNFDGGYPLIVEADASPVGVGCVLLQKINGEEKPVYFASKKLSAAEKNYSQIDKEGLALVYAVNKFRYFLLGRSFTIRSDHKPLLGLFGKGKQIPVNANARIQRWALLLSQYDYELVFKAGKENKVADALSRLPVIDDDADSSTPAEYIRLVESLGFSDISFETIKDLTNKDVILKQVFTCVKFGWYNDVSLSEYATVKSDLSIYNGVILYRNRVIIPTELRCKVLQHLHVGHNGITAMKAEARSWVWWPKMDQDISELTKSCSICFKNFQKPPSPVLSWPNTGKPWSRLHIDYAGPVDNKYFLVIVDSHTKFMDIHVSSSVTSSVTIGMLRKSFCNFGLPDMIVSDNAPNFVSQEMEAFLKKNGIRHVTPAPYNPSSNGLAERSVRTFKEGLEKFKHGDVNTRICRFLYNYRRTVHSSTGRTPAEIMFNRNFRGTVESVKQKGERKVSLEKLFQSEESLYAVGDAVFARNFGYGNPWVEGKIVEVLGLRNYKVQLKEFGNLVWKRHADQLMQRFIGDFPNCGSSGLPEYLGEKSIPDFKPYPNVQVDTGVDLSADVETNVGNEVVHNNRPSPVSVSETPMLRRSGRMVKAPDRLDL